MEKIVLTEARKAEIKRANEAAQQMYICALDMLELAEKCAEDYDLNEQEMREVVISPILLFIVSRKGLTDQEKKELMKLMISQACDIYEGVIGPLDDEKEGYIENFNND